MYVRPTYPWARSPASRSHQPEPGHRYRQTSRCRQCCLGTRYRLLRWGGSDPSSPMVKIPSGYWTAWGGTSNNWSGPPTASRYVRHLAAVFTLLFAMFGNVKGCKGGCWYLPVIVRATGGVVALWLRDIPLSISAGIGFIVYQGSSAEWPGDDFSHPQFA